MSTITKDGQLDAEGLLEHAVDLEVKLDRLRDDLAASERLRDHAQSELAKDSALVVRLQNDVAWKDGIIKAADRELGRLRTALRVNGLRWGATDAEIDAVLHPYSEDSQRDER